MALLPPTNDGMLIGIAPGSVWATKRWSVDGFAAVASALCQQGARCVVIGAPEDRERADAVVAAAGPRAISLVGRTDIATVVAVIDRLDLLVANDSAPMHIACAVGTPVVAVFCATTPALGYGPWGARARVVEAPLACRPCQRHGGNSCPRGTEDCIRLITPAAVLAAAQTLLGARHAA
jgi:heptosyltransferase-2